MVVSLGRLASKVQCRFTSTETIIRTIRDGEPRTATSTFTQFLSSDASRLKPTSGLLVLLLLFLVMFICLIICFSIYRMTGWLVGLIVSLCSLLFFICLYSTRPFFDCFVLRCVCVCVCVCVLSLIHI